MTTPGLINFLNSINITDKRVIKYIEYLIKSKRTGELGEYFSPKDFANFKELFLHKKKSKCLVEVKSDEPRFLVKFNKIRKSVCERKFSRGVKCFGGNVFSPTNRRGKHSNAAVNIEVHNSNNNNWEHNYDKNGDERYNDEKVYECKDECKNSGEYIDQHRNKHNDDVIDDNSFPCDDFKPFKPMLPDQNAIQSKRALKLTTRSLRLDKTENKKFLVNSSSSNFDISKTLPIAKYEKEIVTLLHKNRIILIQGPTGCGKTTQIPKMLLKYYQRILVSQPRRISAINSSKRVAEETSSAIGDIVGYKVRFEERNSHSTRLLFVTDGMLINECMRNPLLNYYDVVVVDEVHERSVSTDIFLGYMKCLLDTTNIRFVLMSATVDVQKFKVFFGCPEIAIDSFSYPKRIFYLADLGSDICFRESEKCIKKETPRIVPYRNTIAYDYFHKTFQVVENILKNTVNGDILVFLTGQDEIERMEKKLILLKNGLDNDCKNDLNDVDNDFNNDCTNDDEMNIDNCPPMRPPFNSNSDNFRKFGDFVILKIFSFLPYSQQKQIFRTYAKRKVILSTNISENSITIGNLRYVVDSGFVKQKMFEDGLERLVVTQVSREQADQRAGRVGRTCPGYVYRVYTEYMYWEFRESPVPELLRSNLASVILTLKTLNCDVFEFVFLDLPKRENILKTMKLLYDLGCINTDGIITDIGYRISVLPVSPELAISLVHAQQHLVYDEICKIAAMLSIQKIFIKRNNIEKGRERFYKVGDHFMYLELFENAQKHGFSHSFCHKNDLNYDGMREAKRIYLQLIGYGSNKSLSTDIFKNNTPSKIKHSAPARDTSYLTPKNIREKIKACLLKGYFLQIARLKDKCYEILSTKKECYIHPSSSLYKKDFPFVLFHSYIMTNNEYIRECIPIEIDDIKQIDYYQVRDFEE